MWHPFFGTYWLRPIGEYNSETKLSVCALRQIQKTNIKGKLILTMKSGETLQIPLRNVRQYARPYCRVCTDFSTRLSDLSVGGLGLNGWSLVVTRTKTGDRIFEDTVKKELLVPRPISEEKDSLELLIKLSKTKTLNKN